MCSYCIKIVMQRLQLKLATSVLCLGDYVFTKILGCVSVF